MAGGELEVRKQDLLKPLMRCSILPGRSSVIMVVLAFAAVVLIPLTVCRPLVFVPCVLITIRLARQDIRRLLIG